MQVYHIGCDTVAHASTNRSANLIVSGDLEDLADPGAPGHMLSAKGGVGRGPYMAALSNRSDDRTRVTVSTADPYDGRYCAQINLAAETPVHVLLPVRQDALPMADGARFELKLWVRSSPAGVGVAVKSAMFRVGGAAKTAAGAGWGQVRAELTYSNASAPTGPSCLVPPYPPCGILPLEVELTSPVPTGGTVFLDGVTMAKAGN